MKRQLRRGSFLVIEGPDDLRFWQSRVAPAHCELITGDGKQNVEGALVRLDQRGFAGVLGIVDDDFDALVERPLPSFNLLATDAHDLECVLLRSSALERLLAEYGDPAKIRRFEDAQDCTVRTALIERGLVFGRLRWLALRCGWDLGPGIRCPASRAVRRSRDLGHRYRTPAWHGDRVRRAGNAGGLAGSDPCLAGCRPLVDLSRARSAHIASDRPSAGLGKPQVQQRRCRCRGTAPRQL